MSIKNNITAKKTNLKKSIATAIIAISSLWAGAAQAYIPNNHQIEVETSFSFQLSNALTSIVATTPLPRNRPVFLRAGDSATLQLVADTAAVAPLGFQIFCLQNASECAQEENGQAVYSDKFYAKVFQVNLSVNSTIIARNDVGMDQWALDPTEGDCEDYALTKRAALVAAGVPMGSLRIATALTSSNEGHAVLIMRTDQGDLVLDNLNNSVKPSNEVDITLLAISGANPSQWFNIA